MSALFLTIVLGVLVAGAFFVWGYRLGHLDGYLDRCEDDEAPRL